MTAEGVLALVEQANGGSGSELSYEPILIFGAGSLLVVGVLQGIRLIKGGKFSATFARVYGLILIATLAAALVFANVDGASKTGAFTLLGTIAGYLAGARPTTTTTTGQGDGAGTVVTEQGL
jgi:hypothetical protein